LTNILQMLIYFPQLTIAINQLNLAKLKGLVLS